MFEILEYILKESELPEVQQQLLAVHEDSEDVIRDERFTSMDVYNFWILMDGTLISNGGDHSSMCTEAGVGYVALINSGAVRGVILKNELDVQFERDMTESQIGKLKFLFGKHKIHKIVGDGVRGYFSTTINSKDKLDYVLRYGSEEKQD